jgi:hypothetical protein
VPSGALTLQPPLSLDAAGVVAVPADDVAVPAVVAVVPAVDVEPPAAEPPAPEPPPAGASLGLVNVQ